jgi:hypothetical protein
MLPWAHDAVSGGGLFYRVNDDGELVPYLPDDFETNDPAKVAELADRLAPPGPEPEPEPDADPDWPAVPAAGRNGCAAGDRAPAEVLLNKYIGESANGRNEAALALACQLRDNNYAKSEAREVVLTFQKLVHQNGHPFSVSEALRVVNSAYKRKPRAPWGAGRGAKRGKQAAISQANPGPAKRRLPTTPKRHGEDEVSGVRGYKPSVPDYEAFPMHALPGILVPFVAEAAAALAPDCDPVYVALHSLAAVGGLLGNKVRIRLKPSWLEPPVVWGVIVSESGTVKSPAWQLATAPVFGIEGELRAARAQLLEQYEQAMAEWRKRKDDDEPPERPVPPARRRVLVGDTTVEKLAVILQDNPAGVLVTRDELSGWFQSFNQYKAKGGADVASWLEMFRAGPLLNDRKAGDDGGQALYVPRAAVSVCGTIQPGTLSSLMTPAFRDSGLMARLLLAMPPRKAKVWTDADVDPHTADAYANLFCKLHELPAPTGGPVIVPLSDGAKAVWVEFYNGWNQELAVTTGDLAAALAKLEAYAARLALLHHVVSTIDDPAPSPVSAASMEAGIALARWFAREARRVYAMLLAGRDRQYDSRLLDYIRARGGEVTPKAVRDWNRVRYPDRDAAESALRHLANLGFGRLGSTEAGPRGGRPAYVFRLTS